MQRVQSKDSFNHAQPSKAPSMSVGRIRANRSILTSTKMPSACGNTFKTFHKQATCFALCCSDSKSKQIHSDAITCAAQVEAYGPSKSSFTCRPEQLSHIEPTWLRTNPFLQHKQATTLPMARARCIEVDYCCNGT